MTEKIPINNMENAKIKLYLKIKKSNTNNNNDVYNLFRKLDDFI